jgi:uncharacterized membrane protein SpoIIM required for sporulation
MRSDRLRTRLHDVARALRQSLDRLLKARGDRITGAFEAIENFERLSSEVYRLRSMRSAEFAGLRSQGEDLLVSASHELIGMTTPRRETESGYEKFIREYRQAWREHLGLFGFCVSLFFATALLGWNIGANQPDYLALFMSASMLEMINDHHAWFERLQSDPLMGGFEIALNNIQVSLLGFFSGAIFGLGSILILGYNGLILGAVFGYCRVHGFDDALLGFTLSHGPLELTVIVASCFSGMLIGRVF